MINMTSYVIRIDKATNPPENWDSISFKTLLSHQDQLKGSHPFLISLPISCDHTVVSPPSLFTLCHFFPQ